MKNFSKITALFCVFLLLFSVNSVIVFAEDPKDVYAKTVTAEFDAGQTAEMLLKKANIDHSTVTVYDKNGEPFACSAKWTSVDSSYNPESNEAQTIRIEGEIEEYAQGLDKGDFDGKVTMEAKIVPRPEFSYIEVSPDFIEFQLGPDIDEVLQMANETVKTVKIVDNYGKPYICDVSWTYPENKKEDFNPNVVQQITLEGEFDWPEELYVNDDNDHIAKLRMVSITKDVAVKMPHSDSEHPDGMTSIKDIEVPLYCDTIGAQIYYTIDGTEPTTSSRKYTAPIKIKGKVGEPVTVTIKAIAVKNGLKQSAVAELTYTVDIPEYFIESIRMYSSPNITSYEKGAAQINLTGGRIRVFYRDGTSEIINITEDMIDPLDFDPWSVGSQTITVTYGGAQTSFTIKIRSSGSSGDNYSERTDNPPASSDNDYETEESQPDDNNSYYSEDSYWYNVQNTLSSYSYGSEITIDLKDNTLVPADIINTAAQNKLVLIIKANSALSWRLDTGDFTGAKSNMSAGIMTDSIYIPQVLISNAGEREIIRFHIGENKLKAELIVNTSADRSKFVNMFMYDAETQTLNFIDCDKVAVNGTASLLPSKAGDYVIIADSETKLPGDMDNSATLTVEDAEIIFDMLTKGETEDLKADYNGDGVVNALDVSALLQRVGADG